jgi:hypothetical protein
MAEIRAINAFLHHVMLPKLEEMRTRLTTLEGRK